MKLLEKKIDQIQNQEDLVDLLQDHENEPLSLCSHHKTPGAKDPSATCGGLVSDFISGKTSIWRGCKKYDDNFMQYAFTLEEGNFIRIN